MTGLLDTEQYKQIAERLEFPSKAIINGAQESAASGKTYPTHTPATGELLAKLPACGARDVDMAVACARSAWAAWAKRHPSERKRTLLRLADLIEKHALDLSILESLDSGKTI